MAHRYSYSDLIAADPAYPRRSGLTAPTPARTHVYGSISIEGITRRSPLAVHIYEKTVSAGLREGVKDLDSILGHDFKEGGMKVVMT